MTVVHTGVNPEAFRRNPKLGIGLGLILLAIAIGGLYVEYREYSSLGEQPQAMTIEQAIPATVPDGARWVQLTESLTPNCALALQERPNGSVTGTRVLASDVAKQRWVYVRMQGEVACDAAAQPLKGILKKADSGLPSWLQQKGIVVPASSYHLMEISVNEGPDSVITMLWVFGGVGVLASVITIVFATMKPARPISRGASAGR